MNKPVKDVDAYIARAPAEWQPRLRALRAAIKAAAPAAVERLSYGMPYYDYKGRLVYFSLAKAHIGLYIPGSVLKDHQEELAAYETTAATLRLPLDKKLPVALVKKLVKARLKQIEEAK